MPKSKRSVEFTFEDCSTLFTEIEEDIKATDCDSSSSFIKQKCKNEQVKTSDELERKNLLINERLMTVDKILEIYPLLIKDKEKIINHVLDKKKEIVKQFILERITVNKKHYYIDNSGNIFDENVTLVGTKSNNTKINYMFDDTLKIINKCKCVCAS